MQNPWNKQPVKQQIKLTQPIGPTQNYGLCYSLLQHKYQKAFTKQQIYEPDYDLFQKYQSIINTSKKIVQLKEQLATQICDQQFGHLVKKDKIEKRIQLLNFFIDLTNQLQQAYELCKQVQEGEQDTRQWVIQDGSVFISIPYEYRPTFINLLKSISTQNNEQLLDLNDHDQLLNDSKLILAELNQQIQSIQQHSEYLEYAL